MVDDAGGEEWTQLTAWWRQEVAGDTVFATDVVPPVRRLIGDTPGPWLDLGCGEGRMMRALDAATLGCDVAADLLHTAAGAGPVVRCRLPDLRWLRPESLGGAYAVLVLEHLDELRPLFDAVRRATRPGGALVVVANHPAFTAEGSGPVVDLADGEVLWRWGPYFVSGSATVATTGGTEIRFHHRSLGEILTTAAEAGWVLERCEEHPLSEAAVARNPGYQGQQHLPRLLAVRWRR